VGQLGLARGGSILRTIRLEETRRLARDLSPTVGALLDAENLRPRDLAGVMVSIGPGSYTGLRVGIASAKVFAYAAGCPLVAVPTFSAIALQAPPEVDELWVIADALQGMIYVQRFARGEPLDELRIERAEEVLPKASADVRFTGPGIAMHAGLLPIGAVTISEADREPTLECLFRTGLSLPPLTRAELFALEPIYLRGSSAEEKAKMNEPRG
jgi:tRNA threonylcarbamoyladenosine biosynthesis protein TsaB